MARTRRHRFCHKPCWTASEKLAIHPPRSPRQGLGLCCLLLSPSAGPNGRHRRPQPTAHLSRCLLQGAMATR
ncbi:Hypothetical predicted protein, partial [Marmota monax]